MSESNPNSNTQASEHPLNAPETAATQAGQEGDALSLAQAELAELKAKSGELADQYLRAKAEAENARRRAEDEISKARKFAVESFADSLLPAMRAVAADTNITHHQNSVLPGFATDADSEIAKLCFTCAGSDSSSVSSDGGKVSFGTEAALFHQAGVPTIVCGPGHIAQAHQPNEWVELAQLCDKINAIHLRHHQVRDDQVDRTRR